MRLGRALSAVEIDAYDHVPIEVRRAARLISVPLIPGGYAGLTLYSLVLLARETATDGTSALVAHELVHVQQWRAEGPARFLVRYLGAFLRGLVRERSWGEAYRAIPAEVDARVRTSSWQREQAALQQREES